MRSDGENTKKIPMNNKEKFKKTVKMIRKNTLRKFLRNFEK